MIVIIIIIIFADVKETRLYRKSKNAIKVATCGWWVWILDTYSLHRAYYTIFTHYMFAVRRRLPASTHTNNRPIGSEHKQWYIDEAAIAYLPNRV